MEIFILTEAAILPDRPTALLDELEATLTAGRAFASQALAEEAVYEAAAAVYEHVRNSDEDLADTNPFDRSFVNWATGRDGIVEAGVEGLYTLWRITPVRVEGI